jgi:hypothetical protein
MRTRAASLGFATGSTIQEAQAGAVAGCPDLCGIIALGSVASHTWRLDGHGVDQQQGVSGLEQADAQGQHPDASNSAAR